MIRVLVVDDHPMMRMGVCAAVDSVDDMQVVGRCSDGSEVQGAVVRERPTVIVMDVRMPGKSGLEATRELVSRDPAVRVVLLTGSTDPHTVHDAVDAGAAGFLPKGGDPVALIEAVRRVAGGETVWPAVTSDQPPPDIRGRYAPTFGLLPSGHRIPR